MPDEPGNTPDDETGEQPPPPDDLSGEPWKTPDDETGEQPADGVEPFEPSEEVVFADGFEGGDTRAWSLWPRTWKGKTAIIGGTALLGVAAYFIFVDQTPAETPAQDQAIEQSASEVPDPPEQGDAASEIAPGAAAEEQPLGQADEVEDLPPAEEPQEPPTVIEPQGPITFTMDLFGGTCPEYASEYSQTVKMTADPAPAAGEWIVWMVNPESGQAVHSAPWDPLSGEPVVMDSQGETSEKYGLDPETGIFDYDYVDVNGLKCSWQGEILDLEDFVIFMELLFGG